MNCKLWASIPPLSLSDSVSYHHLNHFSLFGGGYRGGAVSIMKTLLTKYGTTTEI